ncbi:MAG: ABC transporter ATP-binding protein [Desulfuromonas sp.]|nr:MAG: ABC transporter ATP-binding protein [Desulfuromonas sp.]
MQTGISVHALRKSFSDLVAVDNLSLTVERGEVLGFLGPNGAGKSTTMKMLTGFLPPDSGSISIAGIDLLGTPRAAKEKIGYLPEGAPLYAEMTPESLLGFVAKLRGLNRATKEQRLIEVAERIHLREVWRQPIETLSKGFKRRVGLALALLHDPEVLILDEPTDGLDPNQKQEIRQLVREIAANKTIIISTHILEEVDALCSRAMIIASGREVANGTPAELRARDPQHGAVTLTLKSADATTLRSVLERQSSIAKVSARQKDAITTLQLMPQGDIDLLPLAAATAKELETPLQGLQRLEGDLNRVFRLLTQATGGAK